MVSNSGQESVSKDQINVLYTGTNNVSNVYYKTLHQHDICNTMYINVSNSCYSAIRYTFNKLVPKFTEYTSYQAGNLSKVVPTKETKCHEK